MDKLSAPHEVLITADDLRREAQRLIESREMPPLEKLLAAVAKARLKYRDQMIAARRLGPDEEG